MHLGSDSQAFLMKAKAVQAMVVDKQQPKRPFAAQRDGDLWSRFYSALHARGPHSVCFTKVKGHATKQQVEAGEVRMQDKIGNDAADQAAEEGVQTFGAKLARLAARLQDRHRSYSVFMQHLQERLVRFYEARYQLRQEMDAPTTAPTHHRPPAQLHNLSKRNPKARRVVTKTMMPPTTTSASSAGEEVGYFAPTLALEACAGLGARPGAPAVHAFLRGLRHRFRSAFGTHGEGISGSGELRAHQTSDTEGPTPWGTTWLELFIVFKLQGHPDPLPADGRRASARPSLQQQLVEFRSLVRNCAELLFESKVANYFKGKAQGMFRLRCLGISTNLAVLPLQLALDAKLIREISIQVIRSQRRWPRRTIEGMIDQGSDIEVRRVSMKGRAKWISSLRPWKGEVFLPASCPRPAEPRPPRRARADEEQLESTAFECPYCDNKAACERPAFDLTLLDGKTWCKRCKVSRPVRRWRCLCGNLWHACPAHSSLPQRLRDEQARAKAALATQDAQPLPLQVGQTQGARSQRRRTNAWLDAPVRGHKRAAEEVRFSASEVAATRRLPKLGERLQKKFPRLSLPPAAWGCAGDADQ